MDMVVEEMVDKELTKVVEQVNKELVKEFNKGLMKVYLWNWATIDASWANNNGFSPRWWQYAQVWRWSE